MSSNTKRLLKLSLDQFDPCSVNSTQDPFCPDCSPSSLIPLVLIKKCLKSSLIVIFCLLSLILIAKHGFQHHVNLEERDLTPYKNCDVFFLEVSDASLTLDAKLACAVESAANSHPNNSVCLVMNSEAVNDMRLLRPVKKQMRNVANLFVVPLDLDTIFRGTPIESWWEEDFKFASSPWRHVHLSEAARLAFVYKYGGLYLDTDMLVLDDLLDDAADLGENYVGLQGFNLDDGVSAAVMRFWPQHPFIAKWLYSVPGKYLEENRACIGPELLSRLIVPYCQGDPPESRRNLAEVSGKTCDYKLKVNDPSAFNPLPWPDWKMLFYPDMAEPDKVMEKLNSSKAVHMWHELSHRVKLSEVSAEAPFMRLAEKVCPNIYFREIEQRGSRKRLTAKQLGMLIEWNAKNKD